MMGVGAMLFLMILGLGGAGCLVAIVAIVLNYFAKAKGLNQGASQNQLAALHEELAAIRNELEILRENQAEMTLMLDESPRRISD